MKVAYIYRHKSTGQIPVRDSALIYQPDKSPKCRTVRLNTGHLATLNLHISCHVETVRGADKIPPPYIRALLSTTGCCIAYEKLRIFSF